MIDKEIKKAFLEKYPIYDYAFMCYENSTYMHPTQKMGWIAFRMFEAGWKSRPSCQKVIDK